MQAQPSCRHGSFHAAVRGQLGTIDFANLAHVAGNLPAGLGAFIFVEDETTRRLTAGTILEQHTLRGFSWVS